MVLKSFPPKQLTSGYTLTVDFQVIMYQSRISVKNKLVI